MVELEKNKKQKIKLPNWKKDGKPVVMSSTTVQESAEAFQLRKF